MDWRLSQIRQAIRRYNASQGSLPSAYHETLTIFWLSVIAEKLSSIESSSDLEAVHMTYVALSKDSRLFKSYYSFDVISSEEARARWVTPDARPLPMPFAV